MNKTSFQAEIISGNRGEKMRRQVCVCIGHRFKVFKGPEVYKQKTGKGQEEINFWNAKKG